MDKTFKPKVTIVIPVYNGERFLKEAIESAINQTYKNIEILIVNDGSTDNSMEIIRDCSDKYPNIIRYFEKENGGVSSALNLAIENMQGNYFSWLSCDDVYKPEKIEKQIDFLQGKEENIVLYSNFDLIDEKNSLIKHEEKKHKELLEKPEYSLLTGAINGITLLIPKEAFNNCGMFDEKLYCTQDYEMWMRMYNKYKFVHQDEILACSRIHPNQETNTNPKVLTEGNKLWIQLIEKFDKDTKIRLEGSEYKYYLKMYNYLKDSQYYAACRYARKKCKEFKNDKDYNKNDIKSSISFSKIIRKVKTFMELLKNNPKKLKTVIHTKISKR